MNNIIPYGKQYISEDDIYAVINTLKSDYLTQGPKISEFENEFARYIGCDFAVAVSNGTAALHLSCLALNLSKGQKVITTPITFAASANCVRYCDADIVFSDIDPDTYLLNIDAVISLIEKSPKGTYSGIIPVNFAGRVIDLEKLRKIADENNLWIIEDACHSPGGYFLDSNGALQNSGNGRFADVSVFSFHPVKHIACGEGGMITTNNESIYKKLIQLRTHGITRDQNNFLNSLDFASGQNDHDSTYPNWYMEMHNLGFNYRLTDFQAALGLCQLKRADDGILKRKAIASKYFDAFKNCKFIKGQSGYIQGHAYHLYVIEVENRLNLYNFLKGNNILAQVHYIPCHLMPYYRQFGWKEGDMVNAEKYYESCLSLPMFPTLTIEEQEFVIKKIIEFYEN